MPALNEERTNPFTGRAEVWTGYYWQAKASSGAELSAYAKKENLAKSLPRKKVWSAADAAAFVPNENGEVRQVIEAPIPPSANIDSLMFNALVYFQGPDDPLTVDFTATGLVAGTRYELLVEVGISIATTFTMSGPDPVVTDLPDWRQYRQVITATGDTYSGWYRTTHSVVVHGPALYDLPRKFVHDETLVAHEFIGPDDIPGPPNLSGYAQKTADLKPFADRVKALEDSAGLQAPDLSKHALKTEVPIVRIDAIESPWRTPQALPFALIGGTAVAPPFALAGAPGIDSIVYDATGSGAVAVDMTFAAIVGKEYEVSFAVRTAQSQSVTFRSDGNASFFVFNGPLYAESYPGFTVAASSDWTVIRYRFTPSDAQWTSRLSFLPGAVQGPVIRPTVGDAQAFVTPPGGVERRWALFSDLLAIPAQADISVQNSAWFALPAATSYERSMPGGVYTSLYFEFSHWLDQNDVGSFSLADFTTGFNTSGFYGGLTRFINATMPISRQAVMLVVAQRPNNSILLNVTNGIGSLRGAIRNVILNGMPADTVSLDAQATENNDALRLAELNTRIDAVNARIPAAHKAGRYKVHSNVGTDQSVAVGGAVDFNTATIFENERALVAANLVSGNRIVCPDAGFVTVSISAFNNSANTRLNLVHADSAGTAKNTYTLAIVAPTSGARHSASYHRIPVAAGDRFGMTSASGAAVNVFRAEHHTEIQVAYVP
ncbi:MAG: hypothetical protein ACRCU5_14180 [Rhizobiaceae bacterium]